MAGVDMNLAGVAAGTGAITIADYVSGLNKIYVGISGGIGVNSTDCSTVQTDAIVLRLSK
jgi:hypothetical protein